MKRDKQAIRAALTQSHGINFNQDVHTLSGDQRRACMDAAKACGYRVSRSSYFTLGSAFFVYLTKGQS